MPNPRYTAIFLLVDRSGSMMSIRHSAEDAINEFIKGQIDAEGLRTITISQFDDRYDKVVDTLKRPVSVPHFYLEPRGSTSLLDAMGRGITDFGKKLAALPEDKRPANVIFAVMTDGRENSSVSFTYADVKAKVEHQVENYNWQVIYLGANQDAIAEAARFGIEEGRAITYAANDMGTRAVIRTMDSYVATASAGGSYQASTIDRERASQS